MISPSRSGFLPSFEATIGASCCAAKVDASLSGTVLVMAEVDPALTPSANAPAEVCRNARRSCFCTITTPEQWECITGTSRRPRSADFCTNLKEASEPFDGEGNGIAAAEAEGG